MIIMFLSFWAFLKGYVAVEVTGTSVERFLNLASHRGIYIWDVRPLDKKDGESGGILMYCSIQGFRLLDDCAKKTRSRLKIVESEGLPFIIQRYRKRKILMGGIFFFVLSLYIMSSFIWRIDIEGNERVSSEEIIEFSRKYGLRIGAFKYFVDNREISRLLISEFSDIGWANVHTRGTRTSILISETIETPAPEPVPRDIPCNVVAARDGLITSIVTASGIPMVRQNDIVREGDLLVSGAVPLNTEHIGQTSTIFVHAYAEVWAKMYHPVQFSIPMSYTHKVYTGRERRHHSLQWLIGPADWQNHVNLFHGRISFDNYDKMVSHVQPGAAGDYPLPFIWTVATYREFVPETRHRTVEGAKALADRIITERIIREFDFHVDIIDKQIQFKELPDQLIVAALITTNERIDRAVPIENPLTAREYGTENITNTE